MATRILLGLISEASNGRDISSAVSELVVLRAVDLPKGTFGSIESGKISRWFEVTEDASANPIARLCLEDQTCTLLSRSWPKRCASERICQTQSASS